MHIKARNDDSEDRVFEDKGFFAKGPEFSRVTPDWITSLDSYAIPTMHGGVDAVKPYVDEFIEYAKQHVLKRIFLKNPKLCCGYSWKICNSNASI